MYKKIMVPLDGSELAECVLPHVAAIVRGCESPEVILVRAVEPISIPYGREVSRFISLEQVEAFETHQRVTAEKYLKEVVDRLARNGVTARAEVVNGKSTSALVDFATKSDIDLVVMATHGHSGISRRVWGSVADHLLQSLSIPVLLVRVPHAATHAQELSSN
jgi:nucleotide-binding universal stress UspA family protein